MQARFGECKQNPRLGALGHLGCGQTITEGLGPPDLRENAFFVQGAISEMFDILGPACLVGGHFGLRFFLRITAAMILRAEFSHGFEKRFRIEF